MGSGGATLAKNIPQGLQFVSDCIDAPPVPHLFKEFICRLFRLGCDNSDVAGGGLCVGKGGGVSIS